MTDVLELWDVYAATMENGVRLLLFTGALRRRILHPDMLEHSGRISGNSP